MTDNNDKPMYGVWLTNHGWLKGKDIFADTNLEKVKQVARLVGGTVRFIDESLKDMEQLFIEKEKTKWHIFKNLFNRKINS
jgi:hypothetical protein